MIPKFIESNNRFIEKRFPVRHKMIAFLIALMLLVIISTLTFVRLSAKDSQMKTHSERGLPAEETTFSPIRT